MYFIFKFIAFLPLSLLQLFAGWIAIILYQYNSSMKRITQINIKLAYPTLAPQAQQRLIKNSLKSQCRTYVEFVKIWGMPAEYNLSLLAKIHGEQHFTEALANKKGVIVVVLHYGCWELLNSWLSVYSEPVIMYKPNKIKGINRYLLEARQKFKATLVPTDESGIRAIFKTLKQGGLTVILPDHLPKLSGGVYSDFFGQNALSSTLVSKLAAKTQCNVVGLSCIRRANLTEFDVHCHRLPDEIRSKGVQQSVDCLNQEIEKMISIAPEQYIWSYKRFRNVAEQDNIYNDNK